MLAKNQRFGKIYTKNQRFREFVIVARTDLFIVNGVPYHLDSRGIVKVIRRQQHL